MTGIAIVLLAALAAGAVAQRLRQPAFIGYLLAGMVLGPGGFAVIDDLTDAADFAELFLTLFLFAAGLELGARARPATWRSAAAAGGAGLVAGLAVILPLALLLDLPFAAALLTGFLLVFSGIASTLGLAVRSDATTGAAARLANTMLIANAAIFPLIVVVLVDMGGDGFGVATVVKGALAAGLTAAAIHQLGKRPRLSLPFAGLVESGTASALAGALLYGLAGASIAGLVGLPPAWGALLAGLAVGNSTLRAPVLGAIRPLRGLLALALFMFLGVLADLTFIWDNIGSVIALLLAITVIRAVLPMVAMQRLGETWQRACLAAVLTLPLGELGAALALAALAAGGIGVDSARLAFSLIALSLLLSPVWLFLARRLHAVAEAPIEAAGELYDAAFGSDAARMQAEWREEASAPPLRWGFPVDEFSAAGKDDDDDDDDDDDSDESQSATTAGADEDTEPDPDLEPAGDPFLSLGAQVRNAARNGDAPPRFDELAPDDEDGYRPPRPDA